MPSSKTSWGARGRVGRGMGTRLGQRARMSLEARALGLPVTRGALPSARKPKWADDDDRLARKLERRRRPGYCDAGIAAQTAPWLTRIPSTA